MKKLIRIGIALSLISVLFMTFINSNEKKESYEIVTWNNIYNEENLSFFYDNSNEKLLGSLKETYDIKIKEKGKSAEHVLEITKKINELVEISEVENTKETSAYAILKKSENEKVVSAKDMAIIIRDFLAIEEIYSRVGEFRSNSKEETRYYVIEYWDDKYNKWVMVDFIDNGYFANKGIPCSAMEVLQYEIEEFSYIGESKKENYLKSIKKNLASYTISLDNTISKLKSNSNLTYVYSDNDSIDLDFEGKFNDPTIYTKNKNLFNVKPKENSIGKDSKAYIILMKSNNISAEGEELKPGEIANDKLIIGGFSSGKIMDSYYLKLNDGEYELVNKYKEYNFKEGLNKIELSIDGKNTIATIEILRNL